MGLTFLYGNTQTEASTGETTYAQHRSLPKKILQKFFKYLRIHML